MSLHRNFAILLLLVLSSVLSYSQERVLGTWNVFNPYRSTLAICDAGEKIYCASNKGLFSLEVSTGAIQLYDKNVGLSDVNIRTMNYDADSKTLVIAYNNGNIDIIENGTDIYNLSDFKIENASNTLTINSLSFFNGQCYVSSSIGISVINLDKKEVSNTYIIGNGGAQVNVSASAVANGKIYAATAQGVKYAPFNSSNLQNFNVWQTVDTSAGLQKIPFSQIASFNGSVFAVSVGVGFRSDTLFRLSNNLWQPVYFASNDSFINLNVWNGNLYFSTWNNDSLSGKNGKVEATGNLAVTAVQGHVRPVGWFINNGYSWEGDFWNGLFKNNLQGSIESIIPDGPFSSDAFSLDIADDGNLYVCAGGVDGSWGTVSNRAGFSVLKDGSWKHVNQSNYWELDNVMDILGSTHVSSINKTYAASFQKGLVEYDNSTGQVRVLNRTNSPIEPNIGDLNRDAISAVRVDKNGIVWVANPGGSKPLKALKPDGSWLEFSIAYNVAAFKKILIDRNDQLWMPVRRSGEGLLVWSANGTLDNTTDDVSRLLSSGAGKGDLPDAICYCVAEDKVGQIWVGTNSGIGVFYCPGSVLTANGCDADQIKVTRDGYVGYLFGTENVRAIAVDAANRKWIGTTNGLWLISADGKQELLKFTTDNSPLPDNQVTDIAINDKTGEVFISTLGGLVSYQGDAMGVCDDCANSALVYPNPVKPGYDGPIAIKGLVDDAYVKITDVSGRLIHQGKANGTQMIWNGKNYKGDRASSGVYLVFSSTELGKERQVAKILIAN